MSSFIWAASAASPISMAFFLPPYPLILSMPSSLWWVFLVPRAGESSKPINTSLVSNSIMFLWNRKKPKVTATSVEDMGKFPSILEAKKNRNYTVGILNSKSGLVDCKDSKIKTSFPISLWNWLKLQFYFYYPSNLPLKSALTVSWHYF